MRRARLALMLFAAGFLTQQHARADEARFAWHEPDCASNAPLFERRLAELLEPRDRERLAGRVAVTRSPGGYDVELSIELDGRALGTRRFRADSCARAADTAAVAASLAVYDGEGEPQGSAENGITPDIWTRRPEPTPAASRPPLVPLAPPEPLLEARLGLLGLVEIGALPNAAWGGTLLLELGVGKRWSFGVLGSLTASQRRAVQEPRSVHLSTSSAAVRACAAALRGVRLRLDGCAGVQLTQARGRGEAFDNNRTATLTSVAPALGVNFSVQATSYVEWRAELEGALPLSRRRFLVDGDEVARADAVAAAARLGAVLRF
jgi:hypothetical protein